MKSNEITVEIPPLLMNPEDDDLNKKNVIHTITSPGTRKVAQHSPAKTRPNRLLTFYRNHFATDKKTLEITVPVLGFIFSLVCLQYYITAIASRVFEFGYVGMAYILACAAVSVQLYWGLRIGARKHFTPWILLKLIELCLVAAGFIYYTCSFVRGYFGFYWASSAYLEKCVYMVIIGSIIILLNGALTFYMTRKSYTQYKRSNILNNDDKNNISDFPPDDDELIQQN